jgi:ribosomal protein S18 acetylase RimI-like enzyme
MDEKLALIKSQPPRDLFVEVVCQKPSDHQYLNKIRHWWAQKQRSNLFANSSMRIEIANSTGGAFNRFQHFSGGRFLVAAGPQKSEILSEVNKDFLRSFDAIIWLSRSSSVRRQLFDRSVIGNLEFFDVNDPVPALRTAVLRYLTKSRIRVLNKPSEYEDYFRLRYKVWSEVGYISASARNTRSKMELDFSDRTAIPIGYFTEDGAMAGCARLVREIGEEDDERVSVMAEIIRGVKDPLLARNFEYPEKLSHPFDILEAFPGFRKYYKHLVVHRISKAEVSRVIVDKQHRRNGIAEALVDHLVEIARSRGISTLFLACPSSLSNLYKDVGFCAVEGLAADKFLHIQVPSIVMDMRL